MANIKWIANFQDGAIIDSEKDGPKLYGDVGATNRFRLKSKETKCTAIRVQMDGKTFTWSSSPKSKFSSCDFTLSIFQHYIKEIDGLEEDYLVVSTRLDDIETRHYFDKTTHDMWFVLTDKRLNL